MLATKELKADEKTQNLVVCDKGCKKRFELPQTPEQLQSKNAGTYKGQDVTVYYFTCPHCSAEYTTHCETAETLRMIAKLKKLQEKRGALLEASGGAAALKRNPRQYNHVVKQSEQLLNQERKLKRQMVELQGKIKEYLQAG